MSFLIVVVASLSLPYYGPDYVLTRLADFGPDSGWQTNTVFTSKRIVNREMARQMSYGVIAQRDDARPWLEIEHIKPERFWLKKVRNQIETSLFTLRIGVDATDIFDEQTIIPFRWRLENRFRDVSSNQLLYETAVWDFFRPHFYNWKEDEVSRKRFERATKSMIEFSRYRMIRLHTMQVKLLSMTEDGQAKRVLEASVPLISPIQPPELMRKQLDKRPFYQDYFDWFLMPNEAERKKAQEEAEKRSKETPAETRQRQAEEKAQREANRARQQLERDAARSKRTESSSAFKSVSTGREDTKASGKTEADEFVDQNTRFSLEEIERSDFDFKNILKLSEKAVWGSQESLTREREVKVLNAEDLYATETPEIARVNRDIARDQEEFPGWPYMHARLWKERAYSTFLYRRLIERDVDSLVDRQPARNFVTDAEHKRLQYHQVALSAYHRSLRKYDNSIQSLLLEPRSDFNMKANSVWKWDSNWKVGWRAKSLENYVYDQRFKGTHRVVQRLFLLDTDWNPWLGPTFRYDQLLPLEEKDKGDSSNLWHEEIPREVREKAGAYDPFASQRVAPMFDPVPFYIGWDPALHKSVLTTSRLPQGKARVKLVLPATSTKSKWLKKLDFLGIKRFLEETKLYEYVDFLADQDHEFQVYVKQTIDEDQEEEDLEEKEKYSSEYEIEELRIKQAGQELEEYKAPSNYRLDPRLQVIMQGWQFKKLPAEPFDFEFEETIRQKVQERAELLKQKQLAEEKLQTSKDERSDSLKDEIELPDVSEEMIDLIHKKFARKYQLEELSREFTRSRKSLISERNPREFVSPKTWLKDRNQIDSDGGANIGLAEPKGPSTTSETHHKGSSVNHESDDDDDDDDD